MDEQHLKNTQDWQGWQVPRLACRDMSEAEADEWYAVSCAMLEYARERKLSRADLQKLTGIPAGTLYAVLDGTYKGLYRERVAALRRFLDAEADAAVHRQALIEAPDWVETPTATEALNALIYAQTAPAFVLITLGPGMGKTRLTERVEETRPSTWRVVMRPSTRAAGAMMAEIARTLEVKAKGREERAAAVGLRLKRNGRHTLLMLDEAQNLSDEAVNELRYFYDEYKVGIALLGNEDLNGRYGGHAPKEGYGQIHRRIGMRVRRLRPQPGDIDAYIRAWGFEDPEIIRLLTAVGRAHGALGQICETVKLGNIIAVGRGETLAAQHIREAWRNRGGENLQ